MPRNWIGSGSSVEDDPDGALELWTGGGDWDGVGSSSRSSSLSDSSSPIVKAPPSSGTLLNDGFLAL